MDGGNGMALGRGNSVGPGRDWTVRSSAPELSSGDVWKGIRLEQRHIEPSEYPERRLTLYSVGLLLSGATLLEASWPGQPRTTWHLGPGCVNIVPPEIPFAARSRGAAEKIHVEIEPDFFSSIASHCASSTRLQLQPTFGAEDLFISAVDFFGGRRTSAVSANALAEGERLNR